MVAARAPGSADYPALEAAPGRYVKERCAENTNNFRIQEGPHV